MGTTVLNAYSKAYPSITNRIKASVLLQSDPQAVIASQIFFAPHPTRTYSFPGLPRNNYGFSLDVIDGAGVVVSNLANFSVVPGQIEGSLTRGDEQIQVGATNGFDTGATSAIFDGRLLIPGDPTSVVPDYIGWDIVPSELTGRGILAEGVDYSWDPMTGEFDLLIPGDIFPENLYYNIHFNPNVSTAGNSYPTVSDFEIAFISSTMSIDETYFGKKVIVEPAGAYIEITLPDIATVVQGRKMMVEVGGTGLSCVKFKAFGGNTIAFLNGNIFINSNESFSIYKVVRSLGVYEWRVTDLDGNFKTVGELVNDDMLQAEVFNKQLLDGTIASVQQYARIYNEIVLQLPLTQVINYDLWSTANNYCFYSLANSSNPANAGKFRFPDRRGLFARPVWFGKKAGLYEGSEVGPHSHGMPIWIDNPALGFGIKTVPARQVEDFTSSQGNKTQIHITDTGHTGVGLETRPNSCYINQYVRI